MVWKNGNSRNTDAQQGLVIRNNLWDRVLECRKKEDQGTADGQEAEEERLAEVRIPGARGRHHLCYPWTLKVLGLRGQAHQGLKAPLSGNKEGVGGGGARLRLSGQAAACQAEFQLCLDSSFWLTHSLGEHRGLQDTRPVLPATALVQPWAPAVACVGFPG